MVRPFVPGSGVLILTGTCSLPTFSRQRAEGANQALSFKSNVTISLYQFLQIFEYVIKRWRSKEVDDNFKNRMEKPAVTRCAHQLVKHPADEYTLNLFKDFHIEFDAAMRVYTRPDGCVGEFEFLKNHFNWTSIVLT